jgi:hypothetical protein
MKILRKIFQWIFRLAFLLAILVLAFWIRTKYVTNQSPVAQNGQTIQNQNVALKDPKQVDFKWQYNGVQYEITETLYGSLYNFYQNSPKSYQYQGTLPADWEKDYFSMFLKQAADDDSISKVATDIQNLGKQKNLNDDQVVELTLAFVQSIPYDDARAKAILSGNGNANYPYETLYEDKGVCSDKSFLLANLLKQMGYGSALFVYDSENHMAVGIQCPPNYSSYNSGYCYAETTSTGFRIGMIPDIDPNKGTAATIGTLNSFNQSELNQFDTQKLGDAQIFPESNGKTYEGIIKSYAVAKQIDDLRQAINSAGRNLVTEKNNITSDEDQLNSLANKMNKYKVNEDYQNYNKLVPQYNDLLSQIQEEIKTYNQNVAIYNQNVQKYNTLIKSF